MASTQDPEAGTLWRLVTDSQALMQRLFDLRAAELGLTRPLWQVIAGVYRRPGCTQTELALDLAVGRSPLGKAIDKLEEMELVERRPDPVDRRVKRLFLTSAADTYVRPGQEILLDIEARVAGLLSAEELQTLTLALGRIRESLRTFLDQEDQQERKDQDVT